MAGHPTREQQGAVDERRAEALRLKTRGRTFEEIATALGYSSRQHAREDVNRALKNRAEERKVEADTYITGELEKLDMLEREVMKVLEARHYAMTAKGLVWLDDSGNPFAEPLTDDAPVLAAVDRMIKIQERRTKLIGLDAPTKKIIEVTNYDGVDSDIRRLVDELAARGQGTPVPGAFAPRVVLEVPEPAGTGPGDR